MNQPWHHECLQNWKPKYWMATFDIWVKEVYHLPLGAGKSVTYVFMLSRLWRTFEYLQALNSCLNFFEDNYHQRKSKELFWSLQSNHSCNCWRIREDVQSRRCVRINFIIFDFPFYLLNATYEEKKWLSTFKMFHKTC